MSWHCRVDVQMRLLTLLMPHHHMLSFIFLQLKPHPCCHCCQYYHYLYDSCALFESLTQAALLLPCDTSQVSSGEVERGRCSADLDSITIKSSSQRSTDSSRGQVMCASLTCPRSLLATMFVALIMCHTYIRFRLLYHLRSELVM